MRQALSFLLIATLSVVSTASTFAAEEVITNLNASQSVDSDGNYTSSEGYSDRKTTGEAESGSTLAINKLCKEGDPDCPKAEEPALNAPTNSTAANATSTNLGEYKEVACSTDVVFSQNSCNQCFTGPSVKVGEKKTDIFDNWKNSTTDIVYTAVKSEQKLPEMISFGSTWVPSNADESKMWVFHTNVSESFIPAANNSEEFYLNPGSEVRFYQTALGAGYTLESTTKNNGDIVGMLKFPVVYYTQNLSSSERSKTSETHYECVSYTLEKEETPVTPTPKTPETPKDVTKAETGPAETLILIVAAFFIAFGLMISLRKRA